MSRVRKIGDKCDKCGRPLVFEDKTPPHCPPCQAKMFTLLRDEISDGGGFGKVRKL